MIRQKSINNNSSSKKKYYDYYDTPTLYGNCQKRVNNHIRFNDYSLVQPYIIDRNQSQTKGFIRNVKQQYLLKNQLQDRRKINLLEKQVDILYTRMDYYERSLKKLSKQNRQLSQLVKKNQPKFQNNRIIQNRISRFKTKNQDNCSQFFCITHQNQNQNQNQHEKSLKKSGQSFKSIKLSKHNDNQQLIRKYLPSQALEYSERHNSYKNIQKDKLSQYSKLTYQLSLSSSSQDDDKQNTMKSLTNELDKLLSNKLKKMSKEDKKRVCEKVLQLSNRINKFGNNKK